MNKAKTKPHSEVFYMVKCNCTKKPCFAWCEYNGEKAIIVAKNKYTLGQYNLIGNGIGKQKVVKVRITEIN